MADKDIENINVLALAKIDPFVYNDYLTYLELSIALAKKLNESILIINSLSDVVNKIDTNFTDIYSQIDTLNSEIQNVYTALRNTENRINLDVQTQLNRIYAQITALMNDYQTIFNNNLENLRIDLQNEIDQIQLGNVIAYDPTTRKLRKCFTSYYERL